MRSKIVSLLAAGLLAPVLGLAQGAQKPPAPPVPPPQVAAPMQAPATLPEEVQHPIIHRVPYDQWLKQYYKIYKIPKKDAILLGRNRVRASLGGQDRDGDRGRGRRQLPGAQPSA